MLKNGDCLFSRDTQEFEVESESKPAVQRHRLKKVSDHRMYFMMQMLTDTDHIRFGSQTLITWRWWSPTLNYWGSWLPTLIFHDHRHHNFRVILDSGSGRCKFPGDRYWMFVYKWWFDGKLLFSLSKKISSICLQFSHFITTKDSISHRD